MKAFKHITTLFFFILISLQVFAQRKEKIESLKIGYLTQKLNLDPSTAERFWPVYHQYEQELQVVVQEKRRMNQNESRTADDILDQEQKALDIKRKYNSIFSKIINQEQLGNLYQAERDFRQMLINRSRNRDMDNEDMPRRGGITRPPMRDNAAPMPAPRPQRFDNAPGRMQENRQMPNPQAAPPPSGAPERRSIGR
jgi:hypothetical protein